MEGPGDVTLYTALGPQEFPVAGIYSDYASTQGAVRHDPRNLPPLVARPGITAIALHLAPGRDVDAITRQLQARGALQQLLDPRQPALRGDVLAVFDRTFAITGALQLLATVVAFIGVLSALLSVQLEKQRSWASCGPSV